MKTVSKITLILLALSMLLCLVACADVPKTGIWENATYHSDTQLGNGSKTIYVTVKAEEKSITFTVNTDQTHLGKALTENQLIEGEENKSGFWVTSVNGMKIANKEEYWILYKDGAYSATHVNATPIANGECFELVKKKPNMWEGATHHGNKEFGNGAKTVCVTVKAEDQEATFTLKTDKEFLGEALVEHELITGEEGPYGLYITSVNGMIVTSSVNGMVINEKENAYWALYKDGAYSMTGVDTTPIANGECYELVKESY